MLRWSRAACLSGWLPFLYLFLSLIHSLPFPSSCTLRIHCTSWCSDMVLVLQVYGCCKIACVCVCGSLIMQHCPFHPDLHFPPVSNENLSLHCSQHNRYYHFHTHLLDFSLSHPSCDSLVFRFCFFSQWKWSQIIPKVISHWASVIKSSVHWLALVLSQWRHDWCSSNMLSDERHHRSRWQMRHD